MHKTILNDIDWEDFDNHVVIVSGCQDLIDYAIRKGLVYKTTSVIREATEENIRDKHVVCAAGSLPVRLASVTASITEISLHVTPEVSGKISEISRKEFALIANEPISYKVGQAESFADKYERGYYNWASAGDVWDSDNPILSAAEFNKRAGSIRKSLKSDIEFLRDIENDYYDFYRNMQRVEHKLYNMADTAMIGNKMQNFIRFSTKSIIKTAMDSVYAIHEMAQSMGWITKKELEKYEKSE